MEQTRPVSPTPDREQSQPPREEPTPRPRLKLEALEARLAPTDGGTTGPWPL